MTEGDGCPACGSMAVESVRVLEHEPCGAVKVADAFEWYDRRVCPDCGTAADDELRAVDRGNVHRCRDCEQCFADQATLVDPATSGGDEAARASSMPPDAPAEPPGPTWGGDATSGERTRRRILPSARTFVAVVLVLLVAGSAVGADVGPSPTVDRRAGEGEWHSAQSIVIFRNDDLQPYYRTTTMKEVDRVFVEEDVPVTGAVIPAPNGQSLSEEMAVCEYWRGRRGAHPDLFEYALHGYRHEMRTHFSGGSEFGGVPIETQRSLVVRGRRAMENCLGTKPDVFVPPRETYDAHTTRVLASEGFVAISSGTWFTQEYVGTTTTYERHGVVQVQSDGGFVKTWSPVTFYEERTLERRFDRAYANGSLYVQMLHYQYFTTPERLATLRGLIDHMKSKEGVEFMTVGEFARKYRDGRIERTDSGWRIWERELSRTTALERWLDSRLDGPTLAEEWLAAVREEEMWDTGATTLVVGDRTTTNLAVRERTTTSLVVRDKDAENVVAGHS